MSLPSIKPEEAERLQFFLRELQGDDQVAFNLFVISESGFLMIRPHLLHILFEPKNRKSQSGEGYIERLRARLSDMAEEYTETDRKSYLKEEF